MSQVLPEIPLSKDKVTWCGVTLSLLYTMDVEYAFKIHTRRVTENQGGRALMPVKAPRGRASASLGVHEIAVIKGMIERGDRQCDIAVYFNVSQSFINRLKKRRYPHWNDTLVETRTLPPAGPYVLANSIEHSQQSVEFAAHKLLATELRAILAKYTFALTAAGSVHPQV